MLILRGLPRTSEILEDEKRFETPAPLPVPVSWAKGVPSAISRWRGPINHKWMSMVKLDGFQTITTISALNPEDSVHFNNKPVGYLLTKCHYQLGLLVGCTFEDAESLDVNAPYGECSLSLPLVYYDTVFVLTRLSDVVERQFVELVVHKWKCEWHLGEDFGTIRSSTI